MPRQKAREYRFHAAALREMADESSDESHQQSFRRAAQYYDNKAADLEREAASQIG